MFDLLKNCFQLVGKIMTKITKKHDFPKETLKKHFLSFYALNCGSF